MRILEHGPVYTPLTKDVEVSLADTEVADAEPIAQLAKANAAELDRRFPGLSSRYGSKRRAKSAIKTASASPSVAGITIGLHEGAERAIVGRASVVLGSVACRGEALIDKGANVALWLDEQVWDRRIGRAALGLLVNSIGTRAKLSSHSIFTLVDADNVRSHRMVRATGFETAGNVDDYHFAGAVYTDSVLYTLPRD